MTWLKKLFVIIWIIIAVSLIESTTFAIQYSEIEDDEPIVTTEVYVKANQLNGRAHPRKTAFIEALFEKDDILISTCEWSEDYRWIEVYGGETGTVWVSIDYVSERKGRFMAKNEDYNKVKIRSRPVKGKITGYLKKGKAIEIQLVVLGWGKCEKGWINMDLLEEIR